MYFIMLIFIKRKWIRLETRDGIKNKFEIKGDDFQLYELSFQVVDNNRNVIDIMYIGINCFGNMFVIGIKHGCYHICNMDSLFT